MRTASATKVALFLLAAAAPVASLTHFDPDWQRRRQSPRHLLIQSMTAARRYNISAVIIQRASHFNGVEVEMKMEQDMFGRTRFTIWQPSQMRGLISYDDGVNWYTYMPNHKWIIQQESPRVAQDNPALQIFQADQNYVWKLERGPDIASCPTLVVSAVPKAKGMVTRRYYLDSRTSLMLQLETISPDGTKTVQLETRSIAYLKGAPKLPVPGEDDPSIKKRVMPPPERFTIPSSVKDQVGFTPIIADNLPYGFIVKTKEIVGPPHDRKAAIRLSDGLVNETIYQWIDKPSKRRGPFDSKKDTILVNGIRMRALGEVPSALAKKLLQAFVTKG